VKPMLPYAYGPNRNGITYPVYVQPKLKGIRALYQVGHFQTEDEAPLALDYLTEPLKKIFPESIILDGMLYIPNFSEDQVSAAIVTDPELVEYHVFDVVNFNRSFESRFMAPASILTDTQHLHKTKVVETHRLLSAKPINYFYDKWLDAGYDGLIYRLNGCPYISGKSKNLLYRQK
jgi:hypothetical protein